MRKYLIVHILILSSLSYGIKVLIPMDDSQTDHLKAYGLVYWYLSKGYNVEWALNYRGGSFLLDNFNGFDEKAFEMNVQYEIVSDSLDIYRTVENNNMEIIYLEKAPKVAVYAPPYEEPWDDSVRLALDYAKIPYDVLYDDGIISGKLYQYDWLHLHHEDFTGQFGKFYGSYSGSDWYIKQVSYSEIMAKKLGFKDIPSLKKAVSIKIRDYVENGGFLFAMCSATDTLDIALSSIDIDIVDSVYDGSPPDPNCNEKLNYDQTLAFTNFQLITNPLIYEHSDIDTPRSLDFNSMPIPNSYTLFEFSAKSDPIPTLLTQCHRDKLPEFMGQCTAFQLDKIKKNVVILARIDGFNEAKYIYGVLGEGSFTFFAGHDPEDFQHLVGESPTDLSLHKNSPGYRLILNNILFPAARFKELKT
ncbi:MAG: asparagine synthetase B [bacterium]